jgi:hypothetical protein
MITRIPKEFGADFLEDDTFLLSSDFKRAQYFLRTELEFANRPEPRNIAGAWDAANFALRARGGDIPALRELAAAIVAGEAMFAGLLARNDWRINGVILAIAERVPQALKDNEQHKVESARRLAARAATIKPGLEAALTAKGKRWFALSPEWADKDESDIVFWLNPWEQHRYNSGRFTVDELLAWANDTGPVVKQTVSKTA